jgi:hypothetical protein
MFVAPGLEFAGCGEDDVEPTAPSGLFQAVDGLMKAVDSDVHLAEADPGERTITQHDRCGFLLGSEQRVCCIQDRSRLRRLPEI